MDELIIYTNNKCCAKTKKGFDCKNNRLDNKYYCKFHFSRLCSNIEKPDDCFICTENLGNKNNLLSCGHWMHRDCFLKTGKNTCPMCRKKVKLTKREKRLLNLNDSNSDSDDDHIYIPNDLLSSMFFSFLTMDEENNDEDSDSNQDFRYMLFYNIISELMPNIEIN